MRLFFAISLPESVTEQLESLAFPIQGVRWISSTSLHLTLHFVGEVDPSAAPRIREAVKDISCSRFKLGLEGTGAFPDARHPEVLWVGCTQPDSLFRLNEELRSCLDGLGSDLNSRPFRPHLTVARIRRRVRVDISSWLERHGDFCSDSFQVRAFNLYSSELRPAGAVYHVLESYSLKSSMPVDYHSD